MLDDLLGLVGQDLTREPQVALGFLGETRANLQIIKFPHRDGRLGNLGRSVRIP